MRPGDSASKPVTWVVNIPDWWYLLSILLSGKGFSVSHRSGKIVNHRGLLRVWFGYMWFKNKKSRSDFIKVFSLKKKMPETSCPGLVMWFSDITSGSAPAILVPTISP